MKVKYSRSALNQLDGIYEYIGKNNLDSAHEQREMIRTSLNRLKDLPQLGTLTEKTNVLKLVMGSGAYVAYYLIRDELIFILRILHTRQNQ